MPLLIYIKLLTWQLTVPKFFLSSYLMSWIVISVSSTRILFNIRVKVPSAFLTTSLTDSLYPGGKLILLFENTADFSSSSVNPSGIVTWYCSLKSLLVSLRIYSVTVFNLSNKTLYVSFPQSIILEYLS